MSSADKAFVSDVTKDDDINEFYKQKVMKIVCTHCQASYQVDLPEIKPEGVEFKCAKCEQKFLVKPQDTEQARIQKENF